MQHSIIIPHRKRNAFLEQCLWSIARSARLCRCKDYEVVVVDNGSTVRPESTEPNVRFIYDTAPMDPFNKPRLNNLGIEAATGDVLSFLDADAIVGCAWMQTCYLIGHDQLYWGGEWPTKLCYRVRQLESSALGLLQEADDRDDLVEAWFANYSAYPLAFEAYGKADTNNTFGGKPVFGNSQFSIRRDVLGDLRFNEEYEGRGYEDIWFNREIGRHYGDRYLAAIETRPDWTMFHIQKEGPAEEGWGADDYNKANYRRYYAT
jgi:glycosyltransferase involved in cell wall biosynthesis